MNEQDAVRIIDAYATVLKSPEGRRVIRDIIDMTGVFTEAFTGSAQTYYNLGAASIGRKIMEMVCMADPEQYMRLNIEAYRRSAETKKGR